jgi:hypothetical protein
MQSSDKSSPYDYDHGFAPPAIFTNKVNCGSALASEEESVGTCATAVTWVS